MSWKKVHSMMTLGRRKKNFRKRDSCQSTENPTSPEPCTSATKPFSQEKVTSNSNINDNGVVTPPHAFTYEELNAALQNFKLETGDQQRNILFTHPNVCIYFISRDGTVKATSESDTLNIVKLQDDGDDKPRVYLHVGDWVYPLVPGVSPCLKTEYGAFILPDLRSPEEGASVGIILPEKANDSLHELLRDILSGTEEPTPSAAQLKSTERKGRSLSFSQKMIKGARFISNGLVRGAERAGLYMNKRTPKIMERIEPKEKPATISPKVESGIKVAKNVSKGAANVTSYIVSQIDHASHAVGHYLAPRIHSKGTQLLSVTFKYSEEKASKKVDNAFLVAAGAVGGVTTVFGGLVNAGGILAQSLSTNTVKIVEHKYGEPAGAVAGDTINVAGNIFVAGSNLMHLTPHGLLEVAAAEITMGVVEDHRAVLEHSLENKHSMAGSSSKID